MKEISDEQIKEGFKNIAKNRPEWPPKPLEFINLCLGIDPNQNDEYAAFEARAKSDADKRLALPKLKATKETANRHLENMKKLLKS